MTDPLFATVAVSLGGVLAVLFVAHRRDNTAAVANAFVGLVAVGAPLAVELALRLTVDPPSTLGPPLLAWVAVATCLHSIGMLGPYDTNWWWDHLTHTVSAGLVAALVYAGLLGLGESPSAAGVPGAAVLGVEGLVVAVTLVLGVFWELIELTARVVGDRYDVDPVLVQYGWRDTAWDLVFDLAGALAVLALDVRLSVPAASRFPDATATVVAGAGVVAVVSTVAMVLFVLAAGR